MFDVSPFDDGRGRYPDRLSANIPRGLRDVARNVADAQGIPVAEFVRRALISAIDKSKAALPRDPHDLRGM
jgi:hypothetical protein